MSLLWVCTPTPKSIASPPPFPVMMSHSEIWPFRKICPGDLEKFSSLDLGGESVESDPPPPPHVKIWWNMWEIYEEIWRNMSKIWKNTPFIYSLWDLDKFRAPASFQTLGLRKNPGSPPNIPYRLWDLKKLRSLPLCIGAGTFQAPKAHIEGRGISEFL